MSKVLMATERALFFLVFQSVPWMVEVVINLTSAC